MSHRQKWKLKQGNVRQLRALTVLILVFTTSIAIINMFMLPEKSHCFEPVFFGSGQSIPSYPKATMYLYPNRNDSNVDNSPSIGFHSNFATQQILPDNIYDTLTEINTVNPETLILRPNGRGDETQLYRYSSAGYSDNWECVNSSDGDDSYVYWNGTEWKYDLYHITNPDFSKGVVINWVKVGITVKTVRSSASLKGDAKILLFSISQPSFEYAFYNILTSYGNHSVLLEKSPETGDSWTSDELKNLQVGVGLKLRESPQANDMIRCTHVWVEVNYTIPNYELDLEVQWTSVPKNVINTNLCIKAGNNSGNENLTVEYWTGGNYFMKSNVWVTLIPVLLSNQWNNVSVKIDGSVFTIRFKGLNETEDKIQDYWDIDASLIEVTYEPQDNYDATLFIVLNSLFWDWGHSGLPTTGLVFGAVSLISISGLAVRHFFPGEEASFRRRRLKQLDEARKRIRRALEDDKNGES
ncbi:MAG: hypothetical protein QXO71_04910 [Candidatus Jordarchaeaceae archaeon]